MRIRRLLVSLCSVVCVVGPLVTACGGSNGGTGGPDAGSGGGGGSDGGAKPQCSDGIDNDGDGKIDFPNDPGCFSPNQNDESDDCPSGPMCPQCGNGKDDDGNGLIDYPADPGCMSAADPTELTENAAACGGTTIAQLVNDSADGMLDGTSTFATSSPCGGGGNASAIAYELHLADAKVVVATTAAGDATVDTVIDIRGAACSDGSAELACNDNTDPTDPDTLTSTATAALPAGTYYIIVEGSDPTIQGAFHLDVQLLAGAGTACSADTDCGTGLVCNPAPAPATGKVCAKPQCSDGSDNNGDGKTDYPFDPSCTSPSDNSEETVCPGAACPACSDGKDNDGDGKTDFPADPSCTSAAGTSEACTSSDPILTLGSAVFDGDTTGKADDFAPACAADVGGPDDLYQLDVPALASLSIDVTADDFEPVLEILGATCGGSAKACDDFTGEGGIRLGPTAAGTLFLVVDGDDPDQFGTYELTVSGVIRGKQSCASPLVAAGVLTCETGFACKGSGAAAKCLPAQCSDGIDNNHDGKIDYPFDPGCSSPSDDTETTVVCPGVDCPVCSNGSDDDGDGKKDFPADFGCSSAGGTDEVFCATETDPVVVIAAVTTTSTFKNMTSDEVLDCGSTEDNDRAFSLQLPVPVTSLTIDTKTSKNKDISLELFDTQCDSGNLGCAPTDFGDPTTLALVDIPAGNYAIVAQTDDSFDNPGFKLNVRGTVAKGVACTASLFTAHVLACDTGLTCTAGVCQ